MNMKIIEHPNTVIENGVGILRVSSKKQGLQGDSPEQQKIQIENRRKQLAIIRNTDIRIKEWFNFAESASGDFDLQPLQKVIAYCKNPQNKVKFCFFKSIDRMTRGGSIIYGLLKMQLARYGVQPIDVYGIISDKKTNTLEHLDVRYTWSEYSTTWIAELLEAERSHG